MGPIELSFFAVAIIASFWAIIDIRVGLYLAILIDMLRDPIRKWSDSQSIAVTLAGAVIWAALILGVYMTRRAQLAQAMKQNPALRKAVVLLLAALIPGALLATVALPNGALVAMIGAISYIAPVAGLAIGLVVFRDRRSIILLLSFFCVVNGIALIGTVAEWQGVESRLLGGLHDSQWIRYQTGYIVNLITGVYRSPDIMGLHAALVVVFALTLVQLAPRGQRLYWIAIVLWASFSLMLCGRRKMIGIPLAYLASQLVLSAWLGNVRRNASLRAVVGTALLAMVGVLATLRELEVSDEYSAYATTLVTEGADRTSDLVGTSIYETIRQNGLMGAGLGVATQGRHYVGGSGGVRVWQEDGVSRLFIELGLPGVVLLFLALIAFVDSIRRAVRSHPRGSPAREFQIAMLSIVAAAGASFIISHQHFSGDPAMGCTVLILCGTVFAMARATTTGTASVGAGDVQLTLPLRQPVSPLSQSQQLISAIKRRFPEPR